MRAMSGGRKYKCWPHLSQEDSSRGIQLHREGGQRAGVQWRHHLDLLHPAPLTILPSQQQHHLLALHQGDQPQPQPQTKHPSFEKQQQWPYHPLASQYTYSWAVEE